MSDDGSYIPKVNRIQMMLGAYPILGDVVYSRVARSDIWALTKLGAHVTVCGPPTLVPREPATKRPRRQAS